MQHQKRIILCCSIGALLAILGAVAICLIPCLISAIVHQKMALIPSNPSFPLWLDLDLPIYQKFYFYNVTNPKEVEHSFAKPNLVEVGPFVFRLNLSKSSIHFNDDKTTVQFRENRRYFFDRELSVADLSVSLTTLNVPLAVAYDTIDFDSMNPLARLAIKTLLAKQSFFFDATPDELMFAGKYNIISCMAHLIDPVHNPDCYFSYFRGQNDTDDGLYEIYTGLNDPARISSIISLNGSDRLDVWDGDECNRINGSSNGELFPPLDLVGGSPKTLHFFRSDFCRVFNLTEQKADIPADVSTSLTVDRFAPAEHMFANASVNPANACFKPNSNKTKGFDEESLKPTMGALAALLKREGLTKNAFAELFQTDKQIHNETIHPLIKPQPDRPSGVFDLSACHDGVPILISWPHFLNADPYYLDWVTGLAPNASLHQTYIDVEPVTGTPVDFLARIQVNIDVHTEFAGAGKKMHSLVFPAMWQEFSIHITDAMARTISSQTKTPRIAAFTIASLITVVGVCLVLYGGLLIFMHLHRKRLNKLATNTTTTPLLSQDDQDQHQTFDREDSTNNNSIVHD